MSANDSTLNRRSPPGPGALQATRKLTYGAAAIGIAAASVLCAKDQFGGAALVAAISIGAAIWLRTLEHVSISDLVQNLLLFWFATSPIASYYLRFPIERSIITYDRVVFGSIAIALIWNRVRLRSQATEEGPGVSNLRIVGKLPITAVRFEIAWLSLTVVALLSVAFKSQEVGAAMKSAVDAFALPLLAFHFARNHIDLKRHGKMLFLSAIFLSLFLFGTGAYELATGVNLFQYKGSEILRDAEIRVNGPFTADSSFALISLLLALFLRSAPIVFGLKLDLGARLFYLTGLGCALVACLMPLFRSVAIALGVGFLLTELTIAYTKKAKNAPVESGSVAENPTLEAPAGIKRRTAGLPGSRIWWRAMNTMRPRAMSTIRRTAAATILILLLLIGIGWLSNPNAIRNRLFSARNAYSRFITLEIGIRIASIDPLFGVGLSNYDDYFRQEYDRADAARATAMSTHVARGAHSNPMWIAAELGIVGLITYLAANLFLLLPGWGALRHRTEPRSRVAAGCYVALILAYWLPGLSLASGQYSDLNLYWLFLLGLLAGFIQRGPGEVSSHSSQ